MKYGRSVVAKTRQKAKKGLSAIKNIIKNIIQGYGTPTSVRHVLSFGPFGVKYDSSHKKRIHPLISCVVQIFRFGAVAHVSCWAWARGVGSAKDVDDQNSDPTPLIRSIGAVRIRNQHIASSRRDRDH